MPRIDKYDPVSGGFRARLGFAPVAGDVDAIIVVGLDANGRVVRGAGNTGELGVICMSSLLANGDVVDVMTDGEIVDAALAAGTVYYAGAAGAVATAAPAVGANATRVGHTVEAWRLVVRVQRVQG